MSVTTGRLRDSTYDLEEQRQADAADIRAECDVLMNGLVPLCEAAHERGWLDCQQLTMARA